MTYDGALTTVYNLIERIECLILFEHPEVELQRIQAHRQHVYEVLRRSDPDSELYWAFTGLTDIFIKAHFRFGISDVPTLQA